MLFKKTKSSGLTAEIRVRRCYGCGAILQDTDPNEVGYIPKQKFEDENEHLCERCYKLRHYSAYQETPAFSLDYVTILNHAKEENALTVFVVNAFGLKGSFLEGIGKFLPKNVLVVINKRDLLPTSYSDDFLKAELNLYLQKENIHPLDILITSSSTYPTHIQELMEDIDRFRNGKSVYFIGSYQVGKSSLINALLKNYSNSTDKMITTSPYPGTTLDVISIPLDEKTFLYDTPGIYNGKSIISFIEPVIVKYVIPRTTVKPETYAAKENQSFLLSNLARFDFVKGDKTEFTFFKSNDLTIERTKLNKADAYLANISQDDGDTRTKKIKTTTDFVPHPFTAKNNTDYRLVISGLCFIDFQGNGQEINVYAPKGVEVTLDEASHGDL